MKNKDFIITVEQSNDSNQKTIRIINNTDTYDDNGIPQWKPKLKKDKKNKHQKLDPNNLIEAEMIRKRRKALLDSAKALK